MTFHEKLAALLEFSLTQVLPAVVKNPETQVKVTPYIGLGIAGIALIETMFNHTPPPPATP